MSLRIILGSAFVGGILANDGTRSVLIQQAGRVEQGIKNYYKGMMAGGNTPSNAVPNEGVDTNGNEGNDKNSSDEHHVDDDGRP
jgi:hypothetical protein